MTSLYKLRRQEREERQRQKDSEMAVNRVIECKKAVEEFEFIINMAEAKALSKISLERPLNHSEYERFMNLGRLLGVKE